MYLAYKAYGPHSSNVYYGYCVAENIDEIKRSFFKILSNHDTARGAPKLVAQNNDDRDAIQFEVQEVFTDELEAWAYRNDMRSMQSDSITGPTMFPCGMAERAAKEKSESVELWKLRIKQQGAKTARQAWALGMWTNEVIKGLADWYNKKELVADLDKLSPQDFANKYSLTC